MLGWNVAVAPARLFLGPGGADERKRHPVRIGEGKHLLSEALLQVLIGNALFDETLGPVAKRTQRHTERGLMGFADSTTARRSTFPRKECQDGAWAAGLVAVIEVVG